MDKLANLNQQQQDLVNKAQELNDNIEDCGKKLVRAEKMISGLEGEKVRWTETVEKLNVQKGFLVGDSLIAAGMVSYSGPFISQYREDLERLWRDKAAELGIKVTENCTMRDVLGNDVQIRTWAVAGLPSDNLSVENGIIMFGSRRWPLMIDPQTQANKFIKKLGGMQEDTQLEVLKLSETNLIRSLELAIQFGKWVLLENIGEELDPALEPILLQQLTKQGTNYTIKIGERVIQYSFSFKFFMTTTLPNPHYSPETSVKVTILNFSITPTGLEEQMLNLFVLLEMPEMQEQKNQIIEQNAKSAKILYDLEDGLLAALSGSTVAELLETDDLINMLAESQKTSAEIKVKQEEAKVTEAEIDKKREVLRPVAYRAQLLFFAIVDLNLIDAMYQYSL
jgi:dynein heavy chain